MKNGRKIIFIERTSKIEGKRSKEKTWVKLNCFL